MDKKLYILLLIGLLLGACTAMALEPTPTPVSPQVPSPTPAAWDLEGWNIVWHDEFDRPELDLTNWTFDRGGSGWGNAEWQAYTDKA